MLSIESYCLASLVAAGFLAVGFNGADMSWLLPLRRLGRCVGERWAILLVAGGLGAVLGSPLIGQERAVVRSGGVTDSTIAVGRRLFHGMADCAGCHGHAGTGTQAGPDLTDRVWLHGDGSYEMIVKRVTHGVTRFESTKGRPMPMRGWVPIDDGEVRAVAAYVWSLGTGRSGGESER
jgi:mono/diheme cytochrome c family protein